jgi:phosphomannomutase/phosphoglucomutase
MINPDVFREYDVRGIVDKDLDLDFVYNLGRSIGTYSIPLGVKTMTLGMDCRLSSPNYHEAIRKGISSTGIDIIDVGLCATPVLYFAIRHFNADGGVMITGSHNRSEERRVGKECTG